MRDKVVAAYFLAEHTPNAITYPDTGHGSLFQFHESFVRQALCVSIQNFSNQILILI